MGVFYGLAKSNDYIGNKGLSSFYNVMAVVVPVLLHGAYDYIASMETTSSSSWYFIVFVLILFVVSLILVNKMSKNDRYITRSYMNFR